jgi:hypothetical protein
MSNTVYLFMKHMCTYLCTDYSSMRLLNQNTGDVTGMNDTPHLENLNISAEAGRTLLPSNSQTESLTQLPLAHSGHKMPLF